MYTPIIEISVAKQRENEAREARLIHAFLQVVAEEETGNLGWDGIDQKRKEAILAGQVLHRLERHGADDLWPDQTSPNQTDEGVASNLRQAILSEEHSGTPQASRVIQLKPRRLH